MSWGRFAFVGALVFLASVFANYIAQPPAHAEDVSVTPSGGGSGSVTSVAAGCGAVAAPSPITGAGTLSASKADNPQTGANYAIVDGDCGKIVNLSNASNQVPTIGQAGTGGFFAAGWFTKVCNIGAGTQTITPQGGSLIYGAATFVLPAGNVSPQCIGIVSTGTAYRVDASVAVTARTQATTDNSTNLATTAYVTTAVANAVAGVNPAVSVNAATIAASDTSGCTYANGVAGIGATLTCEVNTVKVIDGFTFNSITQSLLVKNDTQSPSGAFNGIYNLTALHTGITGDIYTRRLDYDTSSDINNTGAIPVISGTANGTTSWLLTTLVTTVGTDALSYTKFSLNPTTVVTTGTTVSTTAPLAGGGDLSTNRTLSITGAAGQMLAGAGPAFTATPTLGASGTLGSVTLGNATSGTLTLQPITGALGTPTVSLPAATDTLVGKATTDTFTNKTYDTAATGNSFLINGLAATANTGTGSVVRATTPTLVTPVIGAATGTSLAVTGAVTSSSPTAGIGYAAGAGNTANQGAGSGKATAVTLNAITGHITTDTASLAANATVSFTLNNTSIGANDVVVANSATALNQTYFVIPNKVQANSVAISITNFGATAGEAIVINFVVIKGQIN